jgi:cytochrome c
MVCRVFAVALLIAPLACSDAYAQLRGHGGPVRAVAVSADGATVLSGSFDASAIRWSLRRNAAEQVLRFHDSAVNAAAVLGDGRFVTGGEDGRIAIWSAGNSAPDRVLEGHQGPVAALAVAPDGVTLASASWDRTVRLWRGDGTTRVYEGHQDNANGVAFAPDGSFISAGYDATVRIWPVNGEGAPTVATVPSALNTVAVAPDGEIAAAGANGRVYFLGPDGKLRGETEVGETPIIALSISRDGALVAAAGIRGSVAIIARATRKVERTLVGPGLPVWSLAFLPDGRTLVTGGTDRLVRRWDATTGDHLGSVALSGADDPLAAYAGDRGAEVFRACVACHTLSADEGNRAGPTLHGIFGRKIASLPGYRFSEPLRSMDIVWTPETVKQLFEIGPAAYTPGTKMPEQTIGSAADREALVRFLEKATGSP